MTDTEVVVVGGGPTGLTLAIDLGQRGVRCTLIEQKVAPAFLPKMERINARSMEMLRRLGLSQRIREAGLRSDVPMDVFVIEAMNKPALLRLAYPSVQQALADNRATNDGSAPLEAYQLISQYTLEPLLKEIAEKIPGVTVRFGCEFLSSQQDPSGVTVTRETRRRHAGDYPRPVFSWVRWWCQRGPSRGGHQAARRRPPDAASSGAVSLR